MKPLVQACLPTDEGVPDYQEQIIAGACAGLQEAISGAANSASMSAC